MYVCPWQTRLRSWRAYDGFSNTAPFTVGEPFAPAPEAERVEDWLTSAARPEALVELDYGGLPCLLSNDHLHADRSVEEVSGAVAALAEGETERMRKLRERLLAWWRSVRALKHVNSALRDLQVFGDTIRAFVVKHSPDTPHANLVRQVSQPLQRAFSHVKKLPWRTGPRLHVKLSEIGHNAR